MMGRFQPIGRQETLAGFTGTALAHGALIAAFLIASRDTEMVGTAYAVKLVAAPAPTATAPQRAAAEAVPRPIERTAPIEPPKRAAKPTAQPIKTVPQPKTEAAPPTRNPATPMPGETPSTGADVATVNTPGVEFPFPEYLRTIVNEIYRRWQRPGGPASLRAEITFLIMRDGTVKDIQIASRSRSLSFDLSARGAVEAAANALAFGPLPEGFPSEVLAISLWFQPRTSP
jgi:outer membrane biosynthesis protein TonB